MTCYFDYIPADVLRACLFPYLNSHERLGVNLCLPTAWRCSGQLDTTKLVQMDILMAMAPLRKALAKVDKVWGCERDNDIYKLINEILPRNLIITQYNNNFRRVVLERLAHFSDLKNADYKLCSDEFITRMTAASERLYTLIETRYPYVREVNSNIEDTWSPVDGDPVIIVSGWGIELPAPIKCKVLPRKFHRRSRWGFTKSISKNPW